MLDEIERLAPDRIVIFGGKGTVSADVDVQLNAFAPTPQEGPADRVDFILSTGAYASETGTVTGFATVDFWTVGLAERVNPFGGMLGSSFNFVSEEQLEALHSHCK